MWLIDTLFNRKIEGESSIDSLLDYTNKLKDFLSIDNVNNELNVSGALIATAFFVSGTPYGIDDTGLNLSEDVIISSIGHGLEVDNGALQLEAPILKKLETSAVFNSDDSSYRIDLPALVGRNVIIKYGLNMSQTMAINIGSGNTSSALVLGAFEAGSNAIAYINDCELNTPNGSHITFNDNISAGEEDFDVIVYYEDYYGPHLTYEA